MKEAYFTSDTIDRQAKEFLGTLLPLRTGKEKKMVFNPEKAALLILDMQDYFLEEFSPAYIPSATAIVPNILKLQDMFLDLGIPVYQTRHINNEENAKQMNVWWNRLITRDSSLSLISKDIYNRNVFSLEKSQYDTFLDTHLEERLLEKRVEQVVITGVMTHLCCESTARSAFSRGFGVFFTIDGTATYNRHFHQATLLNLAHGFALTVLTQELIVALESNPPSTSLLGSKP